MFRICDVGCRKNADIRHHKSDIGKGHVPENYDTKVCHSMRLIVTKLFKKIT
jgi:hypothetical protein